MADSNLLSSIERRERRRVFSRAAHIAPPKPRTLVFHGAVAGPCLMSIFFFVPLLGPIVALMTIGIMIRLFWVCRSIVSPLFWFGGAAITLTILGGVLSLERTSIEFWLYILFGISMAGALGALVSAGTLLSDQLERARLACEGDLQE
jgi:hypothetical protein